MSTLSTVLLASGLVFPAHGATLDLACAQAATPCTQVVGYTRSRRPRPRA